MNYKNSPIQEAVFDIKIDKLIGISNVADLKVFKESLPSNYEFEKKALNISGTLKISEENTENNTLSNLNGYVYIASDGKKQFQIRLDGFTLNILKPYVSWEEHFEEFIRFWALYRQSFGPNSIKRIATRYINRIEIPLSFVDFNEYIVNMPPIPKGLPDAFNTFFMQVNVPSPDHLGNVIITETLDIQSPGYLPFILDIDVIQDKELTFENMVERFLKIRSIKNEVFENCITDNTRKLFL